MIQDRCRRALFVTACLGLGLVVSVAAQAQNAPIAGGKNITMIIAYGTGGGYDIYGRLVSRHLGKNLPGTPTVVVKNMPGAGGLVAANSLYNISPKDGSELGVVSQNVVLGQLIDKESVKYDARAFTWIGRATSSVETFYAWHTAKLQSIEDAKKKQVIAGGTGPASSSEVMPRVLNQLIGTQFKTVSGYPDGSAVALALERGEAETYVTPWAVIKTRFATWLRDKKINILVQFSLERHPDLPDVPTALDLAQNEEDRQVFALLASGSSLGRFVIAPPALPAAATATLRTAFDATMKDPALIAEADKGQLEVDSATGAQLQQIVDGLFKVSPEVVAKTAALTK